MDNGEQAVRAQALELLERRNYRNALDLLHQHPPQDADGERHALLDLTHNLEEYASAPEHYPTALQHDTGNQDWREMLGTAKANTVGETYPAGRQVAATPAQRRSRKHPFEPKYNDRHPLPERNRKLRPDPWVGDAFRK